MTAYERARDALDRGDHDAARTAMCEALAADPDLPNGENFAGWIEWSRPDRTAAQLDEAIAHFRAAVTRGREPAAIANLADALVAAKRSAEAIAELEPLDEPVAHNWLGWYFTAQQPELPRAIAHLEAATAARPQWGVAWSNLAKALDAAGEVARACAAFATAIDCGDAHDDALARDRRLQLEITLRSRGETAPVAITAQPDSIAAGVLAAAAQLPALASGRTFIIWPTTRPPPGERPFAIIGVNADGRTSAALLVTERELITPVLQRVELATAAEQLAADRGFHALDVAIALRAALTAQLPSTWWLRADKAELVLAAVGGQVVVVVQPRAAGGVTIVAPDLTIDVPTVDALREALPALIATTRRSFERRAAFAARAISAGRIAESIAAILRADDADGWHKPDAFDHFPKGGQASVYSTRSFGARFAISDDAATCTIRIDEHVWTVHAADELDRAAISDAARVALGRLRFDASACTSDFACSRRSARSRAARSSSSRPTRSIRTATLARSSFADPAAPIGSPTARRWPARSTITSSEHLLDQRLEVSLLRRGEPIHPPAECCGEQRETARHHLAALAGERQLVASQIGAIELALDEAHRFEALAVHRDGRLRHQQGFGERRGMRMRVELGEQEQLLAFEPELAQRRRDLDDHRHDEPVVERPHLVEVDFWHRGLASKIVQS
jgi:tetratricopeptide (TPR) repeat protein